MVRAITSRPVDLFFLAGFAVFITAAWLVDWRFLIVGYGARETPLKMCPADRGAVTFVCLANRRLDEMLAAYVRDVSPVASQFFFRVLTFLHFLWGPPLYLLLSYGITVGSELVRLPGIVWAVVMTYTHVLTLVVELFGVETRGDLAQYALTNGFFMVFPLLFLLRCLPSPMFGRTAPHAKKD